MTQSNHNQGNIIIIGENIHCSRIVKVNGKHVRPAPDGGWQLEYLVNKTPCAMPIPPVLRESADWQAGKLRHCVAAVWQGLNGAPTARRQAADYIGELARRQAAAGAAFLDVNVDEFSPDIEQRCHAMRWLAATAQAAAPLPLSIDSSHPAVLEAGLRECHPDRQPLLNSVSLERLATVELAVKFHARVIASAAGAGGIPATAAARLANLEELTSRLTNAGLAMPDIFMDPLILPVSTDGANPGVTLETIRALRGRFGNAPRITGGFSNVSFGMPARHWINLAFTAMALEAGADSGIVDPLLINPTALTQLDDQAPAFVMARNLLNGQDEFGAEFIAAYRDGLIKA